MKAILQCLYFDTFRNKRQHYLHTPNMNHLFISKTIELGKGSNSDTNIFKFGPVFAQCEIFNPVYRKAETLIRRLR